MDPFRELSTNLCLYLLHQCIFDIVDAWVHKRSLYYLQIHTIPTSYTHFPTIFNAKNNFSGPCENIFILNDVKYFPLSSLSVLYYVPVKIDQIFLVPGLA